MKTDCGEGPSPYYFVTSGTCESNGLVSIHDKQYCDGAAKYFGKKYKGVIIKDQKDWGNGRPTGCSWHKFGNVELWKSSSGDCDVHGYGGCFCGPQNMDEEEEENMDEG